MSGLEIRPFKLSLTCQARDHDLRAFAEAALAGLAECGIPAPRAWDDARGRSGDARDIEILISGLPSGKGDWDGSTVYSSFRAGEFLVGGFDLGVNSAGVVFCVLILDFVVEDDHDLACLVAHKSRCARLSAWLVEHAALYGAEFEAVDGNSDCLPSVPIARSLSQIVVADPERVARSYEDTQAFWRAGWETVADFDGHRVLVREPDLIAGPAYLERVQPHHWALARAAKPGLTRYSRPRVLPEEMPVFNAGSPRLTAVGHDPGSRTVEYSCVLDEGQHVQGWEIYALRNIVETGATSSGDPVSVVRVVFLDEWAARQEKRPLLDVGCEVHCYAESGELERIHE